jgi:16S rRNA (cytosine1402-N4)-methyltransferase
MVQECLTLLQSAGAGERQKVFVDATFGAGGHSMALLDAMPDARVLAIDADPAAVERARLLARKYPGRLIPARGNFGELDLLLDQAGFTSITAVLYDLGISSLQLSGGERGFSFAADEPLDMRLDPNAATPTASDLLGTLSQNELESVLREYGDERYARAIARSIVKRRVRVRAWRSNDLVAAVLSALPRKRSYQRIHPATRTFQALRMAVNADLTNLERSLQVAMRSLRKNGRLVVISFQSAEDRVVKRAFKEFQTEGLATMLTRKPLRPSAQEIARNVRSRSAKLRAVQRVDDSELARAA